MKSYISLLFSVLLAAFALSSCNQAEQDVLVTDVSINQASAEIVIGETLQLYASVLPSDASQTEVNWSSSAPFVAKVSNQGLVTALDEGSTVISATVGGKTGVCTVTVKSNISPSVTIGAEQISSISAILNGKANLGNTSSSNLMIGFQYSKSSGILPSNSTTVEAKDADSEYNYSVGITGLEPGTKYYYRSFVREKGQDTYGDIKEFTTKDLASLLETKDASDIEATSATLNAKLDLTNVQYKSLTYGFLSGSSEGTLNTDLKCTEINGNNIVAILSDLSHKTQYWYKAYVNIDGRTFYGEVKTFKTDVVEVESVSLDKTEYTFNTIGNTLTLKATVLPTDASDNSVEWSSDKATVATVDQNGTVKAIGNGTATITVKTKDQGKTATCAITVAQWVTSITLSKTSLSLPVGDEETISVSKILPDNANNKSFTWSSSSNYVAAVDQNGKITAKAIGNAVIKATANDGSGVFASCSVAVRKRGPSGSVDLGLSVFWATCNICESGFVSSPEGYGDVYAWGETETHYSSKNPLIWKSGKTGYNLDSYKWYDSSTKTYTKYVTSRYYGTLDYKSVIKLEDDVAHVKLGGKWRMPTMEEWKELMNNCTWTWVTNYNGTGVNGRLVTSNINGNSIFLPAASSCWDEYNFLGYNDGGVYWSSTLNTHGPYDAYVVSFGSGAVNHADLSMYLDYRCYGYSVRPVSE